MVFLEESHNVNQQLEPNPEEYDIARVLNNVKFEHQNSNVQCYDQNGNINESIIQSTQDTHNNSDEDTDEEPDPLIQLQEARSLWKY